MASIYCCTRNSKVVMEWIRTYIEQTVRFWTEKKGQDPRRLAVVFDIDYTAITDPDNDKTLPEIQDMYKRVVLQGVTPFFVTARPQDPPSQVSWTEGQLEKLGFHRHGGLYLMPNVLADDDNNIAENISRFKHAARRDIHETKKYEIILNCGDNIHDLFAFSDKRKPIIDHLEDNLHPDFYYVMSLPDASWTSIKWPTKPGS